MSAQKRIREHDYDGPGLTARVIGDSSGVEIEQHDGYGRNAISVYETEEMRSLAAFLTEAADAKDAAYRAFRADLDEKMRKRREGSA